MEISLFLSYRWDFVEISLFLTHPSPHQNIPILLNIINTIYWYWKPWKHIKIKATSFKRVPQGKRDPKLKCLLCTRPARQKNTKNKALLARTRAYGGGISNTLRQDPFLLEDPFQKKSYKSRHPNPNTIKEHHLRHTSGWFKRKFERAYCIFYFSWPWIMNTIEWYW